MRSWLSAMLLLVMGCPAPRIGSLEWVARHYTEALLQSNTEEMQLYAATGLTIQPANRNPNAAALHVVKLCPQGQSTDGNTQNMIVLIGGKLDKGINGVDMVLVKEVGGWKISSAKLAADERGIKTFLRNCQEDTRMIR
jgi:hypothetical protein